MKRIKMNVAQNLPSLHHESSDLNQHRSNETAIYYEYLQEHVAANSMASESLSISQEKICNNKVELEKLNLLWEVYFRPCRLTGFKAQWLTTNPTLIPEVKHIQLALFDGGELQ
jgi:hypothetical protein